MSRRPPPGAALALAGLAAFSAWITWRAKALELNFHTVETESHRKLLHKPAPDLALKALDGSPVSLAGFRGKQSVVVTFGASWCGPCRMEAPVLRRFYEKTHKPGAEYEILAVSIDDERQDADKFAAVFKSSFPVLWDPGQKAASAWGVDSIPQLFLVDKSGKVVYGHTGLNPAEDMALARELGMKDYQPTFTMTPDQKTGGANAEPGH